MLKLWCCAYSVFKKGWQCKKKKKPKDLKFDQLNNFRHSWFHVYFSELRAVSVNSAKTPIVFSTERFHEYTVTEEFMFSH